MNLRTTTALTTLMVLLMVSTSPATAQTAPAEPSAKPATMAAPVDMSEGEIRKVDKDTGKLTIKHGEIKHLDMPPMTMVFTAKDPAMLDKLAVGDKVRFVVIDVGGKLVVTELQKSP